MVASERTATPPPASTRQGLRIEIRGVVQGVGFRPWVFRVAQEVGIGGLVRNCENGVTIDAFGDQAALDRFLAGLRTSPPAAAVIEEMQCQPIAPRDVAGFAIAHSVGGEAASRRVSIPADLATCPDCVRELLDPADRRYRYPFINCTQCGPRFTIVRDVPYDRPATTMAAFTMCADCQREYDDPTDRRFHAQPNACPRCGPRALLSTPAGEPIEAADAVAAAARLLAQGRIVAVKGVGGYHLACDATSAAAVRLLRVRKQRDDKPFAVMAPALAQAETLAHLGPRERELLGSVQRPIVLCPARPSNGLAHEVAPDCGLVGLLLPYTPLHHLLLADTGRPLVMTSGNLSDEPIAFEDRDALVRLGGIADAVLGHDRPIETPCDDSVVRVIAGRPSMLRRSRGYVPHAIRLRAPVDHPILGCGAHLKNTFCLAQGNRAVLGPHVGDLETLPSVVAYEQAILRLERFVGIRPEVIAHDLHPDYASTRYALARPVTLRVAVQHHHAHVAAAMAEHGLPGPVLGVAYDGTGLGTDGAAWGGEILRVTYDGFTRLATLRPIALAGADLAVRQIWRIAVALLDDAFEGDPPPAAIARLGAVPAAQVRLVRQMIALRVNAPLAHGLGRYFDGLAALGLGLATTGTEGHAALRWNLAADPAEEGRYAFHLDGTSQPWVVDLRPMVRGAALDLLAGRSAATVSARFHNTLAAATAEALRAAADREGRLPIVLSGGCFQNARLAESLCAAFRGEGPVFLHEQVPAGDGGIALGQAVVADAVVRRG